MCFLVIINRKYVIFTFLRLNENLVIKIADFGLTKDVHEKEYYIKGPPTKPLPLRWMSTEAILFGKFSTKSDMVRNFLKYLRVTYTGNNNGFFSVGLVLETF